MTAATLPDDGRERYTTRDIQFAHPFTLGASPEVYPAGPYQVETKDQALDAAGHTAHLRTSTVVIIPTRAGTRSREVRGSDLDDALQRDARRAGHGPSENPDRGEADRQPEALG